MNLDHVFLIEPKTYEEAMAQNARLKAVVRCLEKDAERTGVGIFLEPNAETGALAIVVCAPTRDEVALGRNIRHALADVVETFERMGPDEATVAEVVRLRERLTRVLGLLGEARVSVDMHDHDRGPSKDLQALLAAIDAETAQGVGT